VARSSVPDLTPLAICVHCGVGEGKLLLGQWHALPDTAVSLHSYSNLEQASGIYFNYAKYLYGVWLSMLERIELRHQLPLLLAQQV